MTVAIVTETGDELGTITLNDGVLSSSSMFLDSMVQAALGQWGDPQTAYDWIARTNNGYIRAEPR